MDRALRDRIQDVLTALESLREEQDRWIACIRSPSQDRSDEIEDAQPDLQVLTEQIRAIQNSVALMAANQEYLHGAIQDRANGNQLMASDYVEIDPMPYEEFDEEYVPRPSEDLGPLEKWKCAVCENTIKGSWQKRHQHIKAHEKWRILCPAPDCTTMMAVNGLDPHLKKRHNMVRGSLPLMERLQMNLELDRLTREAVGLEWTYFPPQNRLTPEEPPVASPCKICGLRIADLTKKRCHVGTHRNLKIPCPFRNCSHSGNLRPLETHIKRKHGKKKKHLGQQENDRFEASKRQFYNEADAAMGEYFD
uniref:C2H2-type domain-containing protein n=1 Tax=Steinernema glaseri TaxID=37863 RepID=A0A1I8AL83_9BILA